MNDNNEIKKFKYIYLNSLEYLDKNLNNFVITIENNKLISYLNMDDYDIKKKNEIIKYKKFEIIAQILKDNNNYYWIWNWSNYSNEKNNISISLSLFNYGINLSKNDSQILKYFLINSKLPIFNNLHLELLLGISSFLTNSKITLHHFFHNNLSNIIVYYE